MQNLSGNKEISKAEFPMISDMQIQKVGKKVIIYIDCKYGQEQDLFDNLPRWANEIGKIEKGTCFVSIEIG